MKTAISLPDEVFKRIERKTRQLGLSRSEFFVRAALRYLESISEDGVTASYDEAFATEDRATEAFRRKATRAALLGVEWKE
jgi:hypothetical protein